jgi:transketolase
LEDGVLVLGVPHEGSELAGHLKLPQTRVLIEKLMGEKMGTPLTLRVILGTAQTDWDTEKRRDIEARRLQEEAINRQKAEVQARSSWETIYDQLSRKYASVQNKSLPQNRANFFREAIDLIVEARRSMPLSDDLAERNYARCLERVSQYSEIPSVLVALAVADKFDAK